MPPIPERLVHSIFLLLNFAIDRTFQPLALVGVVVKSMTSSSSDNSSITSVSTLLLDDTELV